ncbi:MAG: phospholipid carrier-dependent glycosyltransferase [Planctomycetota bacterium]
MSAEPEAGQPEAGSPAPPPARTQGARAGLWVALGILLLGALPSLFARDLWSSDEIRYVEVAREIVSYDSLLVPHLNGEVYAEKPPFYFWLSGALGLLSGSFPVGGRLCSLLATGATCGFLALIARRLCPDPRAAPLAAVIYLTLPSVFERSQEALLDPLVAALALGATWALVESARPARWGPWALWVALASGFLALASMVKGPVAFLSPLIAVPCLVVGGELPGRRRAVGGAWLACGVGVGVTLLWLYLAARQAGWWYFEHMAFRQAEGRVGAETLAHNKPFHYYLGQLPVRTLPWCVLAPGLAYAARGVGRSVAKRSLLWLGIGVLLLSSIGSKRFGYALPFMPAVGLALGAALASAEIQGPWPRRLLQLPLRYVRLSAPWLLGALALGVWLYALALAAAVEAPLRAELGGVPWLLWTGVVAGAAALGARVIGARCEPRIAGALDLALVTGVALSAAMGVVASTRDLQETIRPLMQQVAQRLPADAPLYLYPGHLDGRANLYLGRQHVPTRHLPEEVPALADAHAWVFARGVAWDQVPAEDRARFEVVVEAEVGRRERPWLLLRPRR